MDNNFAQAHTPWENGIGSRAKRDNEHRGKPQAEIETGVGCHGGKQRRGQAAEGDDDERRLLLKECPPVEQ